MLTIISGTTIKKITKKKTYTVKEQGVKMVH